MATQTGVVTYRGKLGKTVGYKHRKKQCCRSLPEKVNRSIPTQLSATDFGTASKAGKLARRAIQQELDIRRDPELTNRMNKEMLQVIYAGDQQRGARYIQRDELPLLTGFRFNSTTNLGRLLSFTPTVVQDAKGNLRIALPALTPGDIRHSRNTSHIEIKAIAVGINFNENTYQPAVSDKILIDLSQPGPATELILPFKAGDDETVVVLQVRAFSEVNGQLYVVDNLKYFAADIIDIIPSLIPECPATVHNSQPEKKALFQLHTDSTYNTPQRE